MTEPRRGHPSNGDDTPPDAAKKDFPGKQASKLEDDDDPTGVIMGGSIRGTNGRRAGVD
jgi:hypothetical protein